VDGGTLFLTGPNLSGRGVWRDHFLRIFLKFGSPLYVQENLVDISDEWAVNSALVDYATSANLDLEPYICTLKQIMAGTDVLEESEPDSGLRCLMDIENMRE
jgi:hypothetical protein